MTSNDKFEMVAKTFQGLEDVLAEELRGLGAEQVETGKRMVSFFGTLETLYKANLCCRTALRILKPFYKFTAKDPDDFYDKAKDFDWSSLMTLDKTFSIDSTTYSDEFTHSRYVTYRLKDAIVDWFKDRYGQDKRPGVRLQEADVMINVHISGTEVTLSLDSSGEPLYKRGYRVAQTEAPINEVLAAGIILRSGWCGESPFVDPMCGSGTFLIEAALIAANINPGIYRRGFAFEHWKDFDSELFDRLYSDDSAERTVEVPIIGADISPKAIAIAEANIKSAGVAKYVTLEVKPISRWEEAPQPAGVVVTNPPYGERISAPDMEALYSTIGSKLKHVFCGYHAWIIGYHEEYFHQIGLAPSQKAQLLNGSLECELREYVIFEGDKKSFVAGGGKLKDSPKESLTWGEHKERRELGERRSEGGFGRDRGERRFGDRRDDRRPGSDRDRGERRFGDRRDDRRPGSDRDRGERRFGDRRDDRRPGSDRDRGERRFNDRRDDRRPGSDRDRGERRFGDRRDDRRPGSDRDRGERRFSDRRDDRRPSFDRNRDHDFKPSRFNDDERSPKQEESENPLAIRRNPHALKSIGGKMPSLPPMTGPMMRSRGWKKRDDQGGADNTENSTNQE